MSTESNSNSINVALLKKIRFKKLNPEIEKNVEQLNTLITELNNKNISIETINQINTEIQGLDNNIESSKKVKRSISKTISNILAIIEKNHKIVPKNHYQYLWLAIGAALFGIPIGLGFGLMSHNMGMLGISLPLGLIIGYLIGARMDSKAKLEERQLTTKLR